MKHLLPVCVSFLLFSVASLHAGSVISITDGSETAGTLTLTSTTVNVQTSSSPIEINHADILEANFGETPFHLDAFSSAAGNQLPSNWKAQDMGTIANPGSMTYADGTFKLTGAGDNPEPNNTGVSDTLFFVGQPWTGDGAWTVRVKEIDTPTPDSSETTGGIILRDTLDGSSAMAYIGATTEGIIGFGRRPEAGQPGQWMGVQNFLDLPFWLRLTRYGTSFVAAESGDGKEWNEVGLFNLKTVANPWLGLYTGSGKDKVLGKVTFDHVAFTPAPSEAQVFPPGVVLQSGSFLAGAFEHLDLDPADAAANGEFRLNGKSLVIPRDQIAAVTLLPTSRSQLANMGTQTGLLMRNGDFMQGDPQSVNGGQVRINSILLGITNYDGTDVRACVLRAVQAPSAAYEFRLCDGSTVYANDFNVSAENVAIDEISGLTIAVAPDEIAQLRAGTVQVQDMAELNWKATPPASAPVSDAEADTQASPAAHRAGQTPPPPASAAADVPISTTAVQSWEGPNQERVIQAPLATPVEFPLSGKFRAIGVKIALSPDSPPNSNLIIRILADGREIARTPHFKAGDPPRFMQISVQDPKTVAFEADSLFVGVKAYLIDPVAIRDQGPPSK